MGKLFTLTVSSVALMMAFAPLAAYAQVPAAAEPGRVRQQQLPQAPTPQTEAVPERGAKEANIPEGSENIPLIIRNVTIEGNTVYSTPYLLSLHKIINKEDGTLADLYRLVARINMTYQKDGYVLTKAVLPEQDVGSGDVTIRVIEGFVENVETSGTYQSTRVIEEILNRIAAIKPFNIEKLERHMLLLNDLPGLTARSLLRPIGAGSAPGAVAVAIEFSEGEDVNGSVGFNNRGSRFIGPWQATGNVSKYGLLSPYDQTTLATTLTAELEELYFFSASHSRVISADGLRFTMNGSYSRTDSGFNLEPLEVEGSSYDVSASLSYPVIRSRQENLFVTGSFDFKHSQTDILATELFSDDLRVFRLGANYGFADNWMGSNNFDVTWSQGLDIAGASDQTDQAAGTLSRAEATGSFSAISLSASRTQYIDPEWSGFISANAQFSDSSLLSSEEFGYGGQGIGRAYDGSEITGDDGAAILVELRYGGVPQWSELTSQLYTYYDVGQVWNREIGGQDQSGSSAGAGWRFNWDQNINGDLSLAFPLTLPVGAANSANNSAPRIFFTLNRSF